MTTVIYCPDPVLLARFMNGLKDGGVKTEDGWNDIYHPLNERMTVPRKWISIEDEVAMYHNHDCSKHPKNYRHELTADNYDQLLAEVVERHKNK